LKVCQFLIENHHNNNPANDFGITPLHVASEKGHLQVCKLILEPMIDKDSKFEHPRNLFGDTPTHFSAQNGHFEVCKLLIENTLTKILRITMALPHFIFLLTMVI